MDEKLFEYTGQNYDEAIKKLLSTSFPKHLKGIDWKLITTLSETLGNHHKYASEIQKDFYFSVTENKDGDGVQVVVKDHTHLHKVLTGKGLNDMEEKKVIVSPENLSNPFNTLRNLTKSELKAFEAEKLRNPETPKTSLSAGLGLIGIFKLTFKDSDPDHQKPRMTPIKWGTPNEEENTIPYEFELDIPTADK